MSPPPSPSTVSLLLQFFLLLFFFFVFSIVKLSAEEELCHSPTACKEPNHFNISYPFWKLDGEEEGRICGDPNFGINCSNSDPDYPIITINGHDYLVKNINYPEQSITLVDSQVISPNDNACATWRLHRSLVLGGTTPFSYNSNIDLNVTLFSDCARPPPGGIPNLYSISCDSYLIVDAIDPIGSYWIGNCTEKMETAVMRTDEIESHDYDWNASFGAAMEKGFVLDWRYPINHKGPGLSHGSKIAIGVGVGGAFGAIAIAAWWFMNKKKKKKKPYVSSYFMSRSTASDPSSSSAVDLEKAGDYHGVQRFDYSELEEATENFHPKHELGDGGFGSVYKGELRDGRIVAVKRLYENNYKRVEQFMNEIEILHRLSHKNLVRLYGCTSRHSRELLLVYEYIPNGTIADHLHGEAADPSRLPWATRLNIAVETASALAYLHASEVIHRDVKTNNILLDEGFRVKVADFGLSRLFPTHATHVSTAPQGTPGYLDPEYHECYQLTSKSDVYSFGVVLVELLSGLPAVDITRHRHEINLSNMAIAKIQCNALHEFVDKTLGFESDERVRGMVCAVAEVAFQCLQGGKDMRPTMEEVLESLLEIQSLDALGKEEKKVSSVLGSPLVDAPLLCSSKSSTDNSNNVPALSPNSVIAKWPSRSTTHSSSGY